MNAEEYLDSMTIDDRAVNFDNYVHADEIAKVKDASSYHENVKTLLLGQERQKGLELPWKKASKFRFRDSELTIWTGYNGHKKSMLLGYVLLGLLAQEAKACLASLEMPPRKTLERMGYQWVGNGEPTIPYIQDYFDWLHSKLWIYDQVGTVNPERIIGVARYAITELGVSQFVIDSLMKCGIGVDEYNRQKWFTDELSTLAKDTGAHIHLVAHSRKPEGAREGKPSTKYSVSGTGDITNMADNVIVVYQNKDENADYDQLIDIQKQRNGEGEVSYLLWFDQDSMQFKAHSTDYRMSPDDWKRWA